MRKEIQIICVGNPEFGDCGEALTLSTEHEIVCPVCGTSYTAECARRQAVRQDSDKVFNVIIHDDGELTTAALQEAANEEVAAQNCRENPAMFDSFLYSRGTMRLQATLGAGQFVGVTGKVVAAPSRA